jgi:hypothetical protein
MGPAIYTLPQLYIGDSYPQFSLNFNDELGGPINLQGATVNLFVKRRAHSRPVLAWSSDFGNITIMGDGHNVLLFSTKPPEETKGLFSGIYSYDLEVNKDGITKTYLVGTIEFVSDVTKV